MGKKKSKVAKQKQAKAASALQKTLAPTVSKKSKLNLSKIRRNKKLSHKGNPFPETPMPSPSSHGISKRHLQSSPPNEQLDFQNELKSLQERTRVDALSRRNQTKRQPGMIRLQAASFAVEKSTHHLLNETAEQMRAFQDLGQASATPVRRNTTWWKKEDKVIDSSTATLARNPFAALHVESDDEDQAGRPKLSQKPKSSFGPVGAFQFAPSSFSIATSTSSTTTPNNNGEFDPDL